MKKTMFWILAVMALGATVTIASFFVIGPQRVWTFAAGAPDLGSLDLSQITRSKNPHDALACTTGLCDNVDVDLKLESYEATPEVLIQRAMEAARQHDSTLERVDDQSDPTRARFITRSALMKFPDTNWIEAVDLGNGRSGLRIYARAQLGYSDMGANLARMTRLAKAIDTTF